MSKERQAQSRSIQLMVDDLAREEGLPPLESTHPYPIWSPHHAFDAADTMLKALEKESGK